MVDNKGEISFSKLLNEFKIPKVHYDGACSSSCQQKEDCSIIREAQQIAHKIVERIGSMDKIFALLQKPILVGSLKENSRVFFLGINHNHNQHIFCISIIPR